MRKIYFLAVLMILVLSCTNNGDKENQVKKESLDIAVKYAMDKFKEAKKTVEKNGLVTVSDSQTNFVTGFDNKIKYVIDPAKITVGLIDNDQNIDAIVTITSTKGQYIEMPENLILISADGKLILSRVIESDMKILGIKNRIITAEILTKSRNSPLRDCDACKEVVKYQFRMGDLIRME